MRITTAVVGLAMLLPLGLAVKDKKDKTADLEWRKGILLDQSAEDHCRTSGNVNNGNGSIHTRCTTFTSYKVDGGNMIYTFQRDTGRGEKGLDVTVNGPIKFAMTGDKCFLQDDQGKAHEVSFVQKALKAPPSSQ